MFMHSNWKLPKFYFGSNSINRLFILISKFFATSLFKYVIGPLLDNGVYKMLMSSFPVYNAQIFVDF